jgi:glycosyltransferase involved in cell wall biosynthesis
MHADSNHQMKPLRITHAVSSLQIGGAEKFVVNLAKQQSAMGHDVSVFSYGSDADPLYPAIVSNGIRVTHASSLGASRLRRTMRLADADVIHIHSPAIIRAVGPVFPALLGKNVIYTIHGEGNAPLPLLRLTHQIARLYLAKVTAVSDSARQSVTHRYGWDPDDIEVIDNGIPLPASIALNLGERLRLGCVSRLIPLKNIPLLFLALRGLPPEMQRRVEVVVIGDGPERKTIERCASEVPEIKTTLTGEIRDGSDIFHRLDILVNCSDTEGLPMSMIEAMGHGRPVIATAVGAVPTLVKDGDSGWLYEAGDAAALQRIVAGLLTAPELVKAAGLQARSLVENRYNISTVADRFDSVYRT